MRRVPGFCLAILLSSASLALAQDDPPIDRSIEINHFEPAIGPHSFLTISGAETDSNGVFALAFLVNFMTKPFTNFNVNMSDDEITSTRTEVVSNYLSGTLQGSYGFRDKYQ